MYNMLPNTYLSGIMHANLEKGRRLHLHGGRNKFAEEMRKTLTDPPDNRRSDRRKSASDARGQINSSSTDYADVSWNVPSVSMTARDVRARRPAHSWQATACAVSTIG